MWFVDTEVFKHDWLMVAINPATRTEVVIVNNRNELHDFYRKNKKDIWIMYNGAGYDQFIIKGLLLGFDPKAINDFIIVEGRKGFEYSKLFNKITLNVYDVMPNIPVSLKVLEGFLGNDIHETSVPFSIERRLTDEEIAETIKYCRFDVMNTIEVFCRRKVEFDSKFDLIKFFKLPLENLVKSQAQLAAVILDAKRTKFDDEWEIRVPDNAILGKYQAVADWFLDKRNHHEDAELKINIAGLEHTIAWGGVHAGISKAIIVCDENESMFDADVGQLYPNIMRHYKLISRAARKPEMLDYMLDTSMRLKAEGKTEEREPWKRQCNIIYGAMGDPYNALYDQLHRKLVCVYGQIFLIDLIEKIEDIVTLINSNTDGIFFKVKTEDVPELRRRVSEWEKRTRLGMDYKEFVKFVSKDVNNYVAVRPNGKYHAKGAYVKELNDLDYDLPIVNEAVKNYILFGKPVDETIYECTDFRSFQKIVKLSSKYKWVEHEQGFVSKVKYGCTQGFNIDDTCWGGFFKAKRGARGKGCQACKYYKKYNIPSYRTTVKYDNKAYRVFASKDTNDGRLLKCDGVRNPAKFGNTPDHCFVYNGDVKNAPLHPKLDREWYVDLAFSRLKDFGVM
jgi:DNA polymerase